MKYCVNKLIFLFVLAFYVIDLSADDFVYHWESGKKYIYQLHVISQTKFDGANNIFSLNELLGYIWFDVDATHNVDEWSFKFGSWDMRSHDTAQSILRDNGLFQEEIITENGCTRGEVKNIGLPEFRDIPLKPFFSGIWIFRLPEQRLHIGESWSYKQEAFQNFKRPLLFNVKWTLLAENELRHKHNCNHYRIEISIDDDYILDDKITMSNSSNITDFSLKWSDFYLVGDMWLAANSNIIVDWVMSTRTNSIISFENGNDIVDGKENISETMISFSLERIVEQDFDMITMPKLKHNIPYEQERYSFSVSFIKIFITCTISTLLILFIIIATIKKLFWRKL